jgi:PAS domain S-box-containing protein
MLTEEKLCISDIERVDRLSKGIDRLAKQNIDAILLDLGLPDSQGLNTFEKIHTVAQQIPILILTAFKDDALALEAVRRGAQDYLIKGKTDGALLIRAITYAIERKKLEDTVEKSALSLKVSEERYRKLFDSIDEGFCVIEMIFDKNYKPLDYRFLEVNSSFERQTGLHEAKGKIMRSLAPNHEAYWFEIYGKVALTNEPVRFTNEAKALNRYYDVFAFPVGKGKIKKVGILFNDISQRKSLEKKLQDQERLATIGATAGMVGHDIRNPLQAITSDIYLAKSDLALTPESEEKRNVLESLQEIEKNIEYINKIVSDLQDFAKPISPRIEETDLEQTIQSVLALIKVPQNVTTRLFIRKDFPKFRTDPAYIQRILINLANNAIQAMPKGGNLLITAATENGKVIITVEDDGEGIPENVRSKLFTPLVTTKSRGQGFGLSVVKRFTEGLGGTVTFESEVGKGTKFIIELPINN